MDVRKIVILHETVFGEAGRGAASPVTRVAGIAVVRNPFVGRHVEDLGALFDLGGQLGEEMMEEVVARLRGPAVSYGKAAVVGALGEFEHGGACIHPKLGKPMRAAIGGGKAVIPSNVKVGPPGTAIDVPLGHKDEPWSFDHFDTLTVSVADSPRPDEIMVVMAVADGGRVHPRCGSGPVTT
ncbi:MAG: amino acid synthesis family protein [Ectothiorhodospiraceae bacterium]|nr:amino acid synthesis family protein [Planctomycetota bacterium]MCP5152427.1 amino acid synthesis family protein [Chromatiales bacterium]MCP5154275.1 amino acid synthesis family protein [Ectothiorhodospiraceae bacterium]